jgi:hypothetical protein
MPVHDDGVWSDVHHVAGDRDDTLDHGLNGAWAWAGPQVPSAASEGRRVGTQARDHPGSSAGDSGHGSIQTSGGAGRDVDVESKAKDRGHDAGDDGQADEDAPGHPTGRARTESEAEQQAQEVKYTARGVLHDFAWRGGELRRV